jgi:ABC-type branched-subunit amino acid transport system substrate-binding protein
MYKLYNLHKKLLVKLLLIATSYLIFFLDIQEAFSEEKIKIGVMAALTGEAASYGTDLKNALVLVNEKYGEERYRLIVEDERCDNRMAQAAVNKLIKIDKVRYILGFPCNSTLLSTAQLITRDKVLAITSCATSGDVLDIGRGIYQLFPTDVYAAHHLYRYIEKSHKKFAILTEENDYPILMERTIKRENERSKTPLEIFYESFRHGETDLRSLMLKIKAKELEAVFINVQTDAAFIAVTKQLLTLNFKGVIYGAYLPGSPTILKVLGASANRIKFVNLPASEDLVTEKGRLLFAEFKKRFGEPQAGFPVVPLTFEAFRILDLAIKSGNDPVEYLQNKSFSGGFIKDFSFNQHGMMQGIDFQMQEIIDGKVVILND